MLQGIFCARKTLGRSIAYYARKSSTTGQNPMTTQQRSQEETSLGSAPRWPRQHSQEWLPMRTNERILVQRSIITPPAIRAREQTAAERESEFEHAPPTERGDVGPIWYSFDLTHKRIEEGGWAHQVTTTRIAIFKGHRRCEHAPERG